MRAYLSAWLHLLKTDTLNCRQINENSCMVERGHQSLRFLEEEEWRLCETCYGVHCYKPTIPSPPGRPNLKNLQSNLMLFQSYIRVSITMPLFKLC